jgi:hypothetical protein
LWRKARKKQRNKESRNTDAQSGYSIWLEDSHKLPIHCIVISREGRIMAATVYVDPAQADRLAEKLTVVPLAGTLATACGLTATVAGILHASPTRCFGCVFAAVISTACEAMGSTYWSPLTIPHDFNS